MFFINIYFTDVIYSAVHPYFFLVPQRERQQVEEALKDVRRNEEEMCQSNQSLLTRLEDVQVKRGCIPAMSFIACHPLSLPMFLVKNT